MIALVTPVYGRFGLTAICLAQRLWLAYRLEADHGLHAETIVVGDDANLDTAEALGLHVVESPNPLGRRINDGFEYAARLGAEYFVFNGSDSWLLPGVLADVPPRGRVRASRQLALCSAEGLVYAPADTRWGRAPYTIGRSLLEPSGFRPVPDDRPNGLDGALRNATEAVGGKHTFITPESGDEPLRVVDFRDGPWRQQMTPWRRIVPPEAELHAPWDTLRTAFPDTLVGRMERFYAGESP